MPQETSNSSNKLDMAASHYLKAGPFSLLYEKGAIRYISYHGYETVRMVYSAVRDQNWDTIEPVILDENISSQDNSFKIDLEVAYSKNDIDFRANYQITGSEYGKIVFEMRGEAFSSFLKNRIGFCVLHPVNECAGKICEITHEDGKNSKAYFPELISPHQPFKNIRSMRWHLKEGVYAQLNFTGDVFETEDQRNWTDASYKTYCTPLELPFPVQVQKGEKIVQVVELVLEDAKQAEAEVLEEKAVFNYFPDERFSIPRIGVGRSSETDELSEKDSRLLRNVKFNHYRIDVKLFEKEWKESFNQDCKNALTLELQLEIGLHIPQENDLQRLHSFIEHATQCGAGIFAIILFQQGKKATPEDVMKELWPLFHKHFPMAKIGGGTDAYFAELNRNRSALPDFDFLSFSINPQVHAFDNASLVETLEAQSYAARSAQKIALGKAVHISPITLKPRFNPNATGPEHAPQIGPLSPQVDNRQKTEFCAGWTVGSVKYLSEAGAESLTYYETVGRRGLLMPENYANNEEHFSAGKNEVFPVYPIFKNILEFAGGNVLKSTSNKPLKFDGLVLNKGNSYRMFLANFQDMEIEVEAAPSPKVGQFKNGIYKLKPQSVLVIDFENNKV